MRRLPVLLFALVVVSVAFADYLPWLGKKPETNLQPTPNPPPGANAEWIFDAERLLSAHESVLAETNYRKEVRIRPNHSIGPLSGRTRPLPTCATRVEFRCASEAIYWLCSTSGAIIGAT